MGQELPILPTNGQPATSEEAESFIYSRVFCQKDNSPPLRLLIDFLKAQGQTPIVPSNIDEMAFDDWAWVQVALGYHRDRKPIHVFCVRDRGSFRDVFEQEKRQFLELLTAHDELRIGRPLILTLLADFNWLTPIAFGVAASVVE